MDHVCQVSGKVAVVTGGGSAIGAAICRRLVDEGARVVAADINEEPLRRLEQEADGGLVGVAENVTVEDDVARMVATAADKFGRLDAAFNVAAGRTLQAASQRRRGRCDVRSR